MAKDSGSFVDRQVVLQTIVFKAAEILEKLTNEDIEEYLFLMNRFNDSNGHISSDHEFQHRYSVYYGLYAARLTPDFMMAYFKLMEKLPRYTKIDLAGICNKLKAKKNQKGRENLQFVFCTKLAATLNPDYPPYDKWVARIFRFNPPQPPISYEERVRRFLIFYDHLRSTIKWLASSPELADVTQARARSERPRDRYAARNRSRYDWLPGRLWNIPRTRFNVSLLFSRLHHLLKLTGLPNLSRITTLSIARSSWHSGHEHVGSCSSLADLSGTPRSSTNSFPCANQQSKQLHPGP
jgi:hypothetical protein